MTTRISRRALLLGGAGLIATTGALAAWASDEDDLIVATLQEMVGPFRMAPQDMRTFIADFKAGGAYPEGIEADAMHMAGILGLQEMATRLSGGLADKVQSFRRRLMTAFVLSTDYLALPEKGVRSLTYVGAFADRPCASPFARFD